MGRTTKIKLAARANLLKANEQKQRLFSRKNNEIKIESVQDLNIVTKHDLNVKEEPVEVDNWHYNDDYRDGDLPTNLFRDTTTENNSNCQSNSACDNSTSANIKEELMEPAYSSPCVASPNATGQQKHCLLCYQECDPLDHATENEENVFRTMFLMKKMLQVPNHILEDYLLNFGSPNSWISLCSMCKAKVDKALEIQQLIGQMEETLRICQTEMVLAIKKSVARLPEISSPYNRRVHNVTDETRSFVRTGEDSSWKSKSRTAERKKVTLPARKIPFTTTTSSSAVLINDKKKRCRKQNLLEASTSWTAAWTFVSPNPKLSVPAHVNDSSASFLQLPSTLSPRSEFSSSMLKKSRNREFSIADQIEAMRKQVKVIQDSVELVQSEGSQLSQLVLSDPVLSSKSIYTCNLCPRLDKMNFHSFVIHILFHHRRSYRCSVCNLYYSSHKELDHSALNEKQLKEDATGPGHVCTQDTLVQPNFPPEKIWSCEHCTKLFDMESQRDQHEQEVHPNKSRNSSALKHGCKSCGKKCRNLKDWSLHRAIEHPEVALLSCYFCDENFGCKTKEGIDVNMGSSTTVADHVRKHHIKNTKLTFALVTCDFCGQNFGRSTDLQEHVNKAHSLNPNRAFSCSICFTRTSKFSLIKAHMAQTHKAGTQERYVCDLCGYSVSQRVYYEVHNLEKHGIRPERGGVRTCKIEGCTYEYLYKQYLDKHMMTVHNAVRKHTCQYCGKGFLTSTHRREHEKIHLNKTEKPFTCKICGNSFALRNYLYIHMRLSHLNRPFASTNKRRPSRKRLSQLSSTLKSGVKPTESNTSANSLSQDPVSVPTRTLDQNIDSDQPQYGEIWSA